MKRRMIIFTAVNRYEMNSGCLYFYNQSVARPSGLTMPPVRVKCRQKIPDFDACTVQNTAENTAKYRRRGVLG